MVKKLFLLVIVILGVAVCTYSNSAKERERSIKLKKDKPTVFISFVRFGRREPLEVGESDQGIWLRLHNNTRWVVWVPSFGVTKEFGDMGLHYTIERFPSPVSSIVIGPVEPNCPKKDVAKDTPVGYIPRDTKTFRPIKSGKSILFSVPREHLAPGLFIRISFHYDWENFVDAILGTEPEHFIAFSSALIEQKSGFE